MKTLIILFTVATLISCIGARCYYGCTCYSDDPCEYYCSGYQCQMDIPIGYRCSGYRIHPRECGSASYCEPSTFTCQFQKGPNQWCLYDYSCLSGYCDLRTNSCQYRSLVGWQFFILIPCLFVVIIVVLVIAVVLRRRQRRLAHGPYCNPYMSTPATNPCSYQNSGCVGGIPPATTPCSYQNSGCVGGMPPAATPCSYQTPGFVGEMPPPAYPGFNPAQKPYQGQPYH